VVNTQTRDAPLAILLIIGLALLVLTIKATPATIHYTIEYYKYIACSKEAFYTGNLKTYTTCSINALKTTWAWLQAWLKATTQGW
jgi:hypothetical protein